MKKFAIKKHSIISGIYDGKFFVFSPSRVSIFSKSGDLLLKFNVGEKYINSFLFGGKVIIPGMTSLIISLSSFSVEKDHRYFREYNNNFLFITECIEGKLHYTVLNRNFEKVYSFIHGFSSPAHILDDGTIIRGYSNYRSITRNFSEEEITEDYVFGFDSTINRYNLKDRKIVTPIKVYPNISLYRYILDGIIEIVTPGHYYLDLKYNYPISTEEADKVFFYSTWRRYGTQFLTTINSKKYIVSILVDTIYITTRDFTVIKKVSIPNLQNSIINEGIIHYRECDDFSVRKAETFFSMVWRGIEVFSDFGFCNYLKLLSSTF